MKNHSLCVIGLLLIIQFNAKAQVDTIPAKQLKTLA
jgi:hypothetical protein